MRHRLRPGTARDLPFKLKLAPGQVIRRCTCGSLWITKGRAKAQELFQQHLVEVRDGRLSPAEERARVGN